MLRKRNFAHFLHKNVTFGGPMTKNRLDPICWTPQHVVCSAYHDLAWTCPDIIDIYENNINITKMANIGTEVLEQ